MPAQLFQIALRCVLGAALVVAVILDVRFRRIPDWVTGTGFILCCVLRGVGAGWGGAEVGLGSGVLGAVVAVGPFLPFAWAGRVGWGDVKLLAVMGVALGFPLAMAGALLVSFSGAVQAVATLLWRGRTEHIPYGVAIAVGSVGAMLWDRSAG